MENLVREPFSQDAVEIDSGFWQSLPVDRRYDKVTYHQFEPLTALSRTARTIKFKLPLWVAQNIYLLHACILQIKCKLVGPDYDKPLEQGSQVAPINLLLLSLFSHLKIWFNDKPLFAVENLYHYRSFLETELTATTQEKQTILQTSGYYEDVENEFDTKDNNGFKNRMDLFSTGSGADRVYDGREVFFCGPLNHVSTRAQ